jgi:hypothetical protein
MRGKAIFINQNAVQFKVKINPAATPESYELKIVTASGSTIWKSTEVFKVT